MTDQELSKKISDILFNMTTSTNEKLIDTIGGVNINEIVLGLTAELKLKSNRELVTEFNETFKAETESTSIVKDFKFKELRIALILEECLELAFALDYKREEVYTLFIKLLDKVYSSFPFIDNGERTVETFDAILDLLVVTYGASDIFNMREAIEEGMIEVHKSNMSKLCKNEEELKQTVSKYKEEGIELISEKTDKGFIVKNKETNKILKSVSYQKPNLKQILIKHQIL